MCIRDSKYSELKGIIVPEKRVPSMIDEFPIFCIIACFAEGETVMTGIKDLRNKESDRIKEMVENLKKIGFSVKSSTNSISIFGNKKINPKKEILIDSKFEKEPQSQCSSSARMDLERRLLEGTKRP